MVTVNRRILLIFVFATVFGDVEAFRNTASFPARRTAVVHLAYSKLPSGISPFEKTSNPNVLADIRKIAAAAVTKALNDGETLIEVDFPPFLGQSKSQFDDFDNISELDINRDFCAEMIPLLSRPSKWFILPDDKECELASSDWTGQLYRRNTKFTSIRAACETLAGDQTRAWGTRIAETVNRATGGDGILADSSKLDTLEEAPEVQLICQPGNGGPVEDWINVKSIAEASQSVVVVNGALDKVRDGYYPGIFFPALAKTTPFYKSFQGVYILKPISDKGLYGWVYRVYSEPWQVILQTTEQKKSGIVVKESVALVSETRPTYAEAVSALIQESQKQTA